MSGVDQATLRELRDAATTVAVDAGRLLLEGFRGDARARVKGQGGDLVTEYDERCEVFLRERLGPLSPSATVVGEEAGGQGGGLAWYVDPIDGTTNFAHGHPWFCLSIGLCEGDDPLVGVVHAPAMGLTFTSAKGQGATRNGEAMKVSRTASVDSALLATGFPHDRASSPDNNYRAFVTLDALGHGVRRCAAAALELAMVADGAYDGFWDRGLKAWDLAAALSLITEAGGRVTDLEGGPLRLERGEVAASNGVVHAAFLTALAHARALPAILQVP
jgi:myo-inositol-1(or 4)-monophosphatase